MTFTPRFPDLVTMLETSVKTYATRPLFGTHGASGWTWMTYGEVGALVDQLRGGIASLGVVRGDRVAVISNNRVEWAIGAYATYGLGACWVPMYENQLDKEWKYILGDSGAKVCFCATKKILERVKKLDIEGLQLVCFDGGADEEGSYQKLLSIGKATPVPAIKPDPADVCGFVYTSGTTGNPKGVRLTHANLAGHVSAIMEVVPFNSDERSLAFLPWAHVFGGGTELQGVVSLGASMAICDANDKLIEYLPEVKPSVLFAVPTIWNRIYAGVQKQMASKPRIIQSLFAAGMAAQSKIKRGEAVGLGGKIALALARKLIFGKIIDRFGGRLKYAVSGAAALSPEVAEFIDNLGITVYEGYGMTETTSGVVSNSPGQRRIGSVGKALPGTTIKLDFEALGGDAQTGVGEIIIYSVGNMAGYHNLPEETAKMVTPDGGLRTGDLGRFDKDGFLFITGRVKELYKLENGKYVAPAPMEEKIALSPFIAQVMVHGSGKAFNVALVVPDMTSLGPWCKENGVAGEGEALLKDARVKKLLGDEIEKHSKDFKGYERVKDFVVLAESFSQQNDMLTPTLKLKRRNVLKRYEGELNALYTTPAAAAAAG